MTRKEWWRLFLRHRGVPAVLAGGGTLPANVVVLPRRVRSFATWAELAASYTAEPAGPAKVLAFVPPPVGACFPPPPPPPPPPRR